MGSIVCAAASAVVGAFREGIIFEIIKKETILKKIVAFVKTNTAFQGKKPCLSTMLIFAHTTTAMSFQPRVTPNLCYKKTAHRQQIAEGSAPLPPTPVIPAGGIFQKIPQLPESVG